MVSNLILFIILLIDILIKFILMLIILDIYLHFILLLGICPI